MEVYYIEAEIFENIMDRIENLSTHVDHLCKKTEEKKLGDEWITRMSAYVLTSPHELYRLSGIPESWHTRKSSIKSTTKRRM